MFDAQKIIKSYAFFDIIGIKKALFDGSALEFLNQIWKSIDAWAFGAKREMGRLLNQNRQMVMIPYLTTISDSIIMSTKEEFEIKNFYELVDQFRNFLKRNKIPFYTIINRDWEIHPHDFPAMGGTGGNYFNMTGAGAAWGNIYLADIELHENKKKWIGRYCYYVIDDKSGKNLVSKHPVKEKHDFIGVNKEERTLFAIE